MLRLRRTCAHLIAPYAMVPSPAAGIDVDAATVIAAPDSYGNRWALTAKGRGVAVSPSFVPPITSLGPDEQSGLQVGDVSIAPTVCYEIVYPDLVGTNARRRNVLLTVSNDAWFADSIGPLQHMQMAQMRARETGRYLVRATNNGVSAIVGPDGGIVERSEQFVDTTLTGRVYPAYGATPFMRWGSLPVVALAAAMLLGVWLTRRRP